MARVAYCVDIDKSVIIGNFEKRGWVSVGPGKKNTDKLFV